MKNRTLLQTALLCLALGVPFLGSAQATNDLWTDVLEQNIPSSGTRIIKPIEYRTAQLDLNALDDILFAAPQEVIGEAVNSSVVLAIPNPDGGMSEFKVYYSPIMEQSLADMFPEIRTYGGYDDDGNYVRLDHTPQGFHAMVLQVDGDSWFIDPYTFGNIDPEYYVIYKRKFHARAIEEELQCFTESDSILDRDDIFGTNARYADCQHRNYRLAISATGEYTIFHGGTVALAQAAQVTTMNRVNGIFERDLAIRMTFIANNNLIIYTDPATDPFSNGNTGAMINENQTVTDAVIGAANYDIGHIFGTNSGGLAQLYSPCSGNKARGVTGSGAPIGDPFDVDYVAHEMGHQYGAQHTQNNNCNRTAATSMEPGSAATIMGYAGICAPNVQNNSDDYFHAISLQEMGNFITSAGHTCPMETALANNPPSVTATTGNVTLPGNTPFALTATAIDPDGDPILYCWEQMDPAWATMPPQATNTDGPNFRSFDPTLSPTRYFPNLSDLSSGAATTWEVLTSENRAMNFRVSLRDYAVGGGCTDHEDISVTFDNSAGPFVVTVPSNTGITWGGNTNETVTWNVAGTNAGAVACANVDIFLSTDGGLTYPTQLADNVPNDGSESILVPNTATTTARIMVICENGTFFDISDNNFTITAATFDYTLGVTSNSASVCQPNNATYTVNIGSIGGYTDPVTLSVSGVPAGAIASFGTSPINPGNSTTLTISNTGSATPGVYVLVLQGNSTSGIKTENLTLTVNAGTPSATTNSTPANGATNVAIPTTLTWAASALSPVTYTVDVAIDAAFSSIVQSTSSIATTSLVVTGLATTTTYYWRVRVDNACASSAYSPTFSFTTNNCGAFVSSDVPVAISASGTPTVTSTLSIGTAGSITDLNVLGLDIPHTYVADLTITLTSPQGTVVTLMDGLCGGNDNIDLNFDDSGTAHASIPCPPIGGGTFQPNEALSAFNGEDQLGTWTLTVTDAFNADGGSVDGWTLEVCADSPCTDAGTPSLLLSANPFCPGGSTTLTISGSLNDAAAWEVYTATNGGGTNVGSTTSTISVSSTGATTFYVRGEGGCTTPGTEASITLNGIDNSNPTISCPSNDVVVVNGSCQVSLSDYTGAATANDDCDLSPTVTQSPIAGTILSNAGTVQTVTLTATDASTNSGSCTFTVTLDDDTAPVVTCPSITEINPTSGCGMPDLASSVSVSDNCDAAPILTSQFPPVGADISSLVGTNQNVTFTASDASGNTGTCTVNLPVVDNTNPTIICPSNTIETVGSFCEVALPDYTGSATISDNCDIVPMVIQSPAPSSVVNGYGTVQTVTLTVYDASTNSANCTFTVTTDDDTAPTAQCQNATVTLNGSGSATLTVGSVDNGSSDNCGIATSNLSQTSFGCADVGNQTVTLTVTDAAGNSSNCTATVTVDLHASDIASFDNATQSFCQSEPNTALAISGTGSTGGTYSSTPTGLSINPSTGVIDFNGSLLNTYTVTYTAPGPCGLTASTLLSVTSIDEASFSYAQSAYCETDTDPTPTITGLSGGTFSFSPAGLSINTSTGQIDLSGSSSGTYNITYTTSGACTNSSSLPITINSLDDASFSYGSSNYCENASDPVPTITGSSGGTFTASPSGLSINSSTGEIDLSASSANTYNVTYTTSGTCPQSSSVSFTIDPLPAQPSVIAGLSPACPNSSQTYTITPVTGAASYAWTLPAGWSGTSTSTSIAASTTNSGGTITVAAVNGCGQSASPQSLAVSIINTDDGIPCTVDACNPANGAVTHTPNDAICDDGIWCNGQETCDAMLGCQSGTPPVLDDGNSCTDDSCDEANDQVVHINNSDPCDDGNPFTINDQCVNGACVGTPIGNIWTGNVNTTWGLAGNWMIGVPTSTDDAIIPTSPTGGVFPEIPSGYIAGVDNIEIQNGASVTVLGNGTLDVFGVLTNNGTVNVNNNGSLLQHVGSTLAGFGTYNVQRQGNTGQNFDYWSSPITSQVGVPGASYLYNSNASTQDDSDDSPSDPGWTAYNGSMTQGVGYAGNGGGLFTFSGTVGNGPVSVPLVYHPFDNTYSQSTPGTPFNLVGNPYPSAVSATQFVADNPGISGTLYFWDDDLSGGTGYHRTDYAYWNGTGGLGTGPGTIGVPNGSIATAQGFMVRALSGGVNLNFNNGQRIAGSNSQFFRMADQEGRLWFSIEKDSTFNQILIGMIEDATFGEDRLYDAVKMHTANDVSIAAISDATEHAIMAFPHPEGNYSVPLLVTVSEDGYYDFRANTMEDFGDYQVVFNDVSSNLNVPLQEGTSVTVHLNAGEHDGRFFLNFLQNAITGIDETYAHELQAWVANDQLLLSNSSSREFGGSIDLFNTLGKNVLSIEQIKLDNTLMTIQLPQLATGVYVVRFSEQKEVISKKVLVE